MRLLVVLCAACFAQQQQPRTVYEKTAEFSKFRALLDLDLPTVQDLYNKEVTVFVPVDGAFQKFRRKPVRNLASYHVAEGAHVFPKSGAASLRSVNDGNPPLWITQSNSSVYVNNALVLTQEFAYSSPNQMNRSQMLYGVDEVLDPMVSSRPNPTALDFLRDAPDWNTNYSTAGFLSDVIQNHLEDFFDGGGGDLSGKYTFFVPVGDTRLNIDAIKAHVVPNRVLFTRPTEKHYWFPTLASADYVKVFVRMENQSLLVAEIVGENNETSRAEAHVVFGNVPLRNGVAHLINQSLLVFPRRSPTCQVADAFAAFPNLNTSRFLGARSGFNEDFDLPAKFTLFAPSDAAWESLGDKLDLFRCDDERRPERALVVRRILERHLVVGEIPLALETLEKVTSQGRTCAKLKTAGEGVCLSARKSGAEYEVTWRGVVAHVSRPNYECADGLIHVIDTPLVDESDFRDLEPRISVDFVQIWKKLNKFL